MKSIITYLLVLFFLASCTMQKRIHRPGWHVQWNSKKSVSKTITGKTLNERASNEVHVQKSTQELSETIYEEIKQKENSVELVEDQPIADELPFDQANKASDDLIPHQNLSEVAQKERALDVVTNEKPQNSDQKSKEKEKERERMAKVFLVLACIFLILAAIFLCVNWAGYGLLTAILIAIFGAQFFLIGVSLKLRSKKEKDL